MNPLSRLEKAFSFTIGQRLITMVVIFILALVSILTFTLNIVKTLELDGVIVDIAGRQRMMIQQYFSEMMLASHGNQPDHQKTQDILLGSLDALKNGGTVIANLYTGERLLIPQAPTDQIRILLDQQRSLLEDYFTKTKSLIFQAPGHSPRPESFLLLNRIQGNLEKNADEVVKLLNAHSREKTLNLLRVVPLIGLLVIILSAILARQVAFANRRLEKEIEQRQKAEDERNRFFALSPDLFCITGFDGKFKVLNPAWEHELGYSTEDLLGETFMQFVHPEDKMSTFDELEGLRKGKPTIQFENRYVSKDGSHKWLLWNAAPSLTDNSIYATARNITNRKLYETELALRDRSINSATNGILIADARKPDMPTIYCNSAFEKITGFTREEVIGQNCRFLQGNDHAQPGLDAIRQAIREGKEGKAELRNYKKDGTLFWNEFYVAPVRDTYGNLTHFIGVQTDITQRKRQEAELAKKTADLARSNDELQQFAYVASHDLQEPLRMVASYTQLLRKRYKGKLDDDADEFIEFAVDGANRMQHLIRDLLEYSRVGAETKPFEKTDCELVFQNVIKNLTASVQEHHADITHDALPCIQANPTLLTQVFQNLIGNALKFKGSAAPKIHVGAKALVDGWEFSVSDNGIGIPQEQLGRIFLIFQRLHSREEYPGTGIGLATCKRIVDKHGGTIWVESEQGRGSTFYFTIKSPVAD
ncbi:PAS domain S-box protein [Candidatus Nitronereus thalassa]|uniref:histidine kinase n=1 Tax=Candidatus Nitronereus thalassa TaxID=3020898 RepID=A0ABU3K7T7_9BACT|nr:PAS domain S-box protein [Candidatus Nitronereus thalassa]MDT7042505.1 PAS domain S-box protein [Candidatus Nitronereus thalassa]